MLGQSGSWLTLGSIYTSLSMEDNTSNSPFTMNTQVPFLLAVLLIHSACGSYSGQAHNYGGYEGHYGHGDLRYHGPTAIPHVLHDGHIADTHEVAAAKAEHYKAVASAKTHSGYGHGGSYSYGGNYAYGNGHGYDSKYAEAYHTVPYHGPLAKPVVLKSGYLADTHEVSVAKAAHHNALITAKAHSGYGSEGSYGYGGDYKNGGDYGYGGSYEYTDGGSYGGYGHGYSANYHTTPHHGPLAKPTVLKSGYLADTHEVAAAKEHHLSALHSASAYYSHDNKW